MNLKDVTGYDHNTSLHHELKVQYAHEHIALRYTKAYADKCLYGAGLVAYARERKQISVKELAEYAMARQEGK